MHKKAIGLNMMSLSGMTIGSLSTNACYPQSLHIILIECAIIANSVSIDPKSFSVLQ